MLQRRAVRTNPRDTMRHSRCGAMGAGRPLCANMGLEHHCSRAADALPPEEVQSVLSMLICKYLWASAVVAHAAARRPWP